MITNRYRLDYEDDKFVAEVKENIAALSQLRAAIFQIAAYLEQNSTKQGFLFLLNTSISTPSLSETWETTRILLKPNITKRLHLYSCKDNEYHGWPKYPDNQVLSILEKIRERHPLPNGFRLPQANARSEILRILLNKWFSPKNAINANLTKKQLGEVSGFSYPTIARVIDELSGVLRKSPEHGIELSRFPKDDWHRMILNSRELRSSEYYEDTSGEPRRPKELIERLISIQPENAAIGGVPAAEEYYKGLNIVGNPRLDICVHAPGKFADLGFLRKLDPALKELSSSSTPATVAIHFVRSKESLFTPSSSLFKRPSIVDCLLDLYDLRFDMQANEWLRELIKGKN